MAAQRQLAAAKQPPFTLHPTLLYEEYPTTRLVHTWHVAAVQAAAGVAAREAHDVTRKHDVPFCPDQSDKERVVRTLHEYVRVCNDAYLHLHDADRYAKVSDVLGGDLRITWDALLTNIQAAARVDANFLGDLREFVRKLVSNNAYQLLDDYLRAAKKPYDMDCYTCFGRLTLLNTLSTYLPGSNGNPLFADDQAMKQAFYRLMLSQWQLAFDTSGNRTDDPNYTMNQLTEFMEQQRIFHNAREEDRRRSNRQGDRNRQMVPRSPAQYPPQQQYYPNQGYNRRFDPRGPPYPRGPPPPPRPYGGSPSGGRGYRSPGRFNNNRQYQTPARGFNAPARGNQGQGRGRGRGTPRSFGSPPGLRPRDSQGFARGARRRLDMYSNDQFYQGDEEQQDFSTDQADMYAADPMEYEPAPPAAQPSDQFYSQDESHQYYPPAAAPAPEDHYYYDEQGSSFFNDDYMQDY